jgi:hypothetical protein
MLFLRHFPVSSRKSVIFLSLSRQSVSPAAAIAAAELHFHKL